MPVPTLNRRDWLAVSAAAAAMLKLRVVAAQTAAGGGDWLAMIEQHHRLIARSFEELLSPNEAPWEQRDLQLRTLHQVLKAHQLAEEHVVYPAAVRAGLQAQAQRLYQQEADAKVIASQLRLQTASQSQAKDPAWRETAGKLRDAVLQHATQEEEQTVYPDLKRRLDAAQNQRLTQLYPLEFSSVTPVRR